MEAIGTLILSWIYKKKQNKTVELIKDKIDVGWSFFVTKKSRVVDNCLPMGLIQTQDCFQLWSSIVLFIFVLQ